MLGATEDTEDRRGLELKILKSESSVYVKQMNFLIFISLNFYDAVIIKILYGIKGSTRRIFEYTNFSLSTNLTFQNALVIKTLKREEEVETQ